jgi:acyl-CoA thioesterase FadM
LRTLHVQISCVARVKGKSNLGDHGIIIDVGPDTTIATLIVKSTLSYNWPCRYPSTMKIGVKVAKLGNTSMELKVGIFQLGQTVEAPACEASLIYVFSDIKTLRPVKVPNEFKRQFKL